MSLCDSLTSKQASINSVKHFLTAARQLKIYFDELFPGDFSASEKHSEKDLVIRVFHLTAFYRGQAVCLFSIGFPHYHKDFGFPLPPESEIVKLYERYEQP